MIFGFLRRAGTRRRLIEGLRERIEAASDRPGLYAACGIPRNSEGRFEAMCLHAILVLRRLRALPPPAADVAQDLVNEIFARLDGTLREMGVGDMAVPKRMKKLAGAFYGRAASYDSALLSGDEAALAGVLARNVLASDDAAAGVALAHYVLASEAALAGQGLDDLLTYGPAFAAPDPVTPAAGAPS